VKEGEVDVCVCGSAYLRMRVEEEEVDVRVCGSVFLRMMVEEDGRGGWR
jgi:hypothetical protein